MSELFKNAIKKGAENAKRKEEYIKSLLENNIIPSQYFLCKDKMLAKALKSTDNKTKNEYISWYAIMCDYRNCTKLTFTDDMVAYVTYMSIINEDLYMIRNLIINNLESKETILKKIVDLTIAENKYLGKEVNYFKCYPGEFLDKNSFNLLKLNELKLTDEGYFTIACKLSNILFCLETKDRIDILKNIFGRADDRAIDIIAKAQLYSYGDALCLQDLDLNMGSVRTALLDDDIYNAVKEYLSDEFKR